MSGNILYEPSSVRGDCGILYMTEGQPCAIPFYFEIPITNLLGETELYKIKIDDIVVFEIKSDIKLISYVIKKAYTGIAGNVAILRLSSEDMQQLFGGKEYIMSVKLYDSQKRIQKTLIKKLQIFIQEVV